MMKISLEVIDRISVDLEEPLWVREQRKKAFLQAEKLPLPVSRYTKLPGFSTERFKIGSLEETKTVSESELKYQFVILDNNIVKKESSVDGVMMDIRSAVERSPDLVRFYLFERDDKGTDRIELLTRALFKNGIFIHIPKGKTMTLPLYTSFILSHAEGAMFVPVVIVAEKGAKIKIVEAFNSLSSSESLFASNVYAYLDESSHLEYISIRNCNKDTFSFITLRSFLKKDASIIWRNAWFGGATQRVKLENHLSGEGATAEEIQVFFLEGREHLDITSKLFHDAPRTTARSTVRGALRDKARAIFQGNVRIEKSAQEADSFLSDHVLLLNPGARADSIPGLEIEANQVRASHSASIGQIDEEQVFYLMSRGLDESEAKKTIVSGFLSPAIDGIPDEAVRKEIWDTFELRW